MSRFLSRCGCWMAWFSLAVGTQSASAFSMYGPAEAWQTSTIGYWRFYFINLPASGWTVTSDDFAWHPHNLGEEYRWNNPVLYYSFDQSFLDYFGSNGVAAVDAAFAVFNSLTNVSSYSADLHEFPLEESRVNYTASALHLFDLKSAAMELIIERLGLADPENWAWCIRARVLPPGLACPHFDFSVVQRNFDPVTWEPTRYVNGTLFTYEIEQTCPPPWDFGDAIEFLVDPEGVRFTALATPKLMLPDAAFYGWFHTGLTRDDVGGLRYLYATNNMNIEGAGTNTITFATNNTPGALQLLVTSNLTTLAELSLTNTDAGLQTLYPGIAIVPGSTTPSFTNVITTNYNYYYTNPPWGSPGTFQLASNVVYDTNVMFIYRRQFANVVTNSYSAVGLVTVVETNLYFPPNAPAGYFTTNITTMTMLTNEVSGDFYIIPTNLCGVQILSNVLTKTIGITNSLVVTNTPTNAVAGSYLLGRTYINLYNEHNLAYFPVDCVSNSIALRQGVEKVTFIRRNYDSLLGQFYPPVTNYYTLTGVTNNTLFRQTVQRVVAQPDILFSAADLTSGFPFIPTVVRSTPGFDITGEQPNLAGPGVIRGPVSFQFNKVGPIYVNGTYPLFVDEAGALLNFAWASYDATTNAPVIYPNGSSIASLENQVLIQISPPYLPDATTGIAYSAQLQTSAATPNWQAPFTWSLAPASPGVPPGLNLSARGLISGIPTQAGFFNFVVQATDAVGRVTQQSYIINVAAHP